MVALLVSSRPARDPRVMALRAAAQDGRLGSVPPPPSTPAAPVRTTGALVAVVSSTAAAGVHAAAGPGHFAEGPLVGGFFVVAALAQLAWAVLVLRRGLAPGLSWAGVVGNLAVVALWVVTRTVGLPVGPVEVEPVGAWDVAATVWELAVVAGCAAAGSPERRTAFRPGAGALTGTVPWSATARAWLVGSVLVLVALAFTGAPA